MIICEINGGVGNQIFQVSTGFCLAIQTQSKLVLDLIGCDSSTSYDGSWHLSPLIKEMQKEMPIGVIRSNSLYRKLVRKIIMLWFRPIRVKKEFIRSFYEDKTLLNSDNNIYIPTIEDKFFGEEAVNLGFKRFFEKLKYSYGASNSNTETVAVHIRRGNPDKSNLLYELFFVPDEWFIEKLNAFATRNYNFVCFTNSIDSKDLSNFSKYNFIVYGKEIDPLEALVRLSTYKNLVLSKSTFSFWAAAISDAKIIISPFESDNDHHHKPFNLNYNF